MLSSLFQQTTIPVLEQTVTFAQARHTVLAGNIANMDTPGYQIQDLSTEDFQKRLLAAIEQRRAPAEDAWPASLGYVPDSNAQPIAQVAKNTKTILRHDKNNFGMEYQVAEMVKNHMMHNLALTIMTQQFRLLQTAISGRL